MLAFTDMSAAKDQDWFCDGIAEEILNALTPLKGLRVAARTSAFSFKGKSDDLRTIGEKLNVTTVLEGSVRRAGDRVRITVQLSDVANGFQLWSERYDRELKDIFDVQDEIAKAIAERLRVTLAGGKDDRLVEQATTNIEAYQLYLRGRALVDRRGASVPAGLDLLRKAVELDPGYSLAWAGVADALTVLAYSGAARGSESKPQAMAAAKRSIELDPTSAVGHTALACASLAVREQPRDGEAGVRASVGAQSELRDGPLLVRELLSQLGPRGLRAGHRRSPPRARQRSAVRVRHDDPRGLSVHRRPAGRGDRHVPPGHSTGPRVVRVALGARHRARNGWTIRQRRSPRSKLPQRCRDATRSPSPVWLESSGRGEAGGGARPASRTDGPRLARLCLAFAPCAHGRGCRAT